ncbi:cell wall hydrolase [Phenylobacterium sp.]|uniref:cell wall hydrolase n=1 Tax=Phenylobacterium sp. TaxID=1871053 RepID=UPI002726DD56|nr:cell wall hydrolase [Phenylobacterium sp.]MDO8378372.1 cell wall hydrolase [Phenylobacterium sp.]
MRKLSLRSFPDRRAGLAALLGAAALLAGCATTYYVPRGDGRLRGVATVAESLSDQGLKRLTADMDPAMLALARRHDPVRQPDLWGRPVGWGSLDLRTPPDLGFGTALDQVAQEINALRPFSNLPIRPMKPFKLPIDTQDGGRALKCLAQAVYYESAREPQLGQEAVAQVVLNRLRHPAYPKSVCGVVYQGAARATGCQFTFTCDGALAQAPEPALWTRAMDVAQHALNGYVVKGVGSATHYHADYVAPYWAPTLVKMKQIGAHIFYRWTGPWGEPPAFTGRYAGGEAYLSPAILGGLDERTQGLLDPEGQGVPAGRKITLSVGGEVRTYNVVDPLAVGGERTRVLGTIFAPRRKPTPEEIKKINESLAAMEAPVATPAAPLAVPAPE